MKNLLEYIEKKYGEDSKNLISSLKSCFLESEFIIYKILEEKEEKDTFRLKCYMDTFLSVYIQEVCFLFYKDSDKKLNCVFKATLPDIWNFSWLYFDLPKYSESEKPFFESIKFSEDPKMVYSSKKYETLEDNIQEFLDDSDFKALKKGVNYSLRTDIVNLLFKDKLENLKTKRLLGDEEKFPKIINDVLNPLSDIISLSFVEDIKNFIDQKDPIKDFDICAYEEKHSDHEVINMDIKPKGSIETSFISLSHLSLYSSTNRFKDVSNGIKFFTIVNIENNDYKIEIEYIFSSSKFVFKIIDEVKLLGVKNDNTLPIKKDFSSIFLREFTFAFSFKDEITVEYLSMVLGPNESWQENILGESFQIDDFALCFEYSPKQENDYNFYTQCNFLLGGGLVHLGAAYPSKQLSGELALHQVISIDAMMKDLFKIKGFPKTNILDLSLDSNFEKKEHSFLFELASDWSFTIFKKEVELLKRVFIKVDWDENSSLFMIDSTMVIADVEIYLMAINIKSSKNTKLEESIWKFEGRSAEGSVIAIGDFAKEFLSVFKLDGLLPSFLRELKLKDIGAKFNTDTKESTFYGTVTTKIFEEDTSLELKVETTKKENKEKKELYNVKFTSKITISSQIFNILFINKGEEEKIGEENVIFKVSWKQKDDETLGLNDIVEFMGIKSFKIPKDIDLALKEAQIVYTDKSSYRISAESKNYGKVVFISYKKDKASDSEYFTAIGIDHSIDLTNLPLVNQVFDEKHKLGIEDIKMTYCSKKFEEDILKKINFLIDKGYGKIDKETQEGFSISLNLNIAGHKELLSLSTRNETKKENTQKQLENNKTTSESKSLITTDNNKKEDSIDTQKEYTNDGTLWYKLSKKLGPVSFEKIGLKYDEGRLYISINSSLSASGLNIDLIQASISTKLDEFTPRFDLKGLGVGYGNSSFELTGTLITKPSKDYDSMEYTGGAVLRTKGFALEAFGSYYDSKNNTSMFIFVEVDRVFGGPPSFVLTGILGGFGYNSQLRIPDIDEMSDFPLISGLDKPALIGKKDSKKATTPTQAIAKLTGGNKPWIIPKAGNIWVAAGIKFTSFELMNSVALVVGEFGKEFSLAILGRSKGSYPKKAKKPFVNFELDLRAYFNPNMGELSFLAKLSNGSYILDKDCHITGGFAMCFWFGDNVHSGDFIISMGGYSPYFSKPNHYPQLDRVGVNWKVSKEVSIKGESYFAVTPSAAMAGGNLQLLFESGNISAWVKAKYDVIVWWNPFYFIAEIAVRVGAAVKVFGKRVAVELGCMLGLWGPGFGGKVKVKILFIITFTISFGASKRTQIGKLSWEEFKENLPDPENYIKIVPIEGVAPKASMEDKNGESINDAGENSRLIVRPNKFVFKTESQIPNSKLIFKSENVEKNPEDYNPKNIKNINIKPMLETGLNSVQSIRIEKENGIDDTNWIVEANTQNVPKALWGKGSQNKLTNGEDALISSTIGFIIKAPRPKVSKQMVSNILVENISYSTIDFDKTYLPILHPFELSGKKQIMSFTTKDSIKKISNIAENKNRDLLYGALSDLGFELDNNSLEELSNEYDSYFTDFPMVKKV